MPSVLTQCALDFGPPPPARYTDPETSLEAAEAIKPHAAELEAKVYRALLAEPDGLTTEELARGMRMSLVTVSPRMAPMERKGMVRRDGTRPNRSGKAATVWVAIPREGES